MEDKSRKIFKREYGKFFDVRSNQGQSISYGYMMDSVPKDVDNSLCNIVDKLQQDYSKAIPFNEYLAGEIDKEFAVSFDQIVRDYIIDAIKYYEVASNGFLKRTLMSMPDYNFMSSVKKIETENGRFRFPQDWIPKLIFDEADMWVNFQAKHEYNPMHDHSGILSLVIWHRIPYYKEDEIKGKKTSGAISSIGDFSFYPVGFGSSGSFKLQSYPIQVDKTYNGTMCIFPSSLMHAVNPFYTSDDYRITFSANLKIEDLSQAFKDMLKSVITS
jgi:hypothetical protein